MKSKIFSWNDIEFQLIIYPPGVICGENKNFVNYALKLLFSPVHIHNIQFAFAMVDVNNGLEHHDKNIIYQKPNACTKRGFG